MILATAPLVVPAFPGGCSLGFSTAVNYVAPTAAPSGKRVYVWPGFDNDNSQWSTVPFDSLIADFQAAGHAVVECPLPAAQPCFFSNGGWQYRDQFAAAIRAVKTAIDAEHGPADDVAGGVSFGGLHAMMAAVVTRFFSAWWAHVPVTYASALTELSGVGDVPRFNPAFAVPSLVGTTGWISWGTADERTNWELTKALAQRLGAGVTKVEYAGQDHTTNGQNVSDVSAWVNALP